MKDFVTIAQLKEKLVEVFSAVPLDDGTTQNELGVYLRPPPLPNIPAIHVADRPVPARYKVLVHPESAEPIPSLEVIVAYNPDFEEVSRNWAHRAIEEHYQIFLIFHDPRQHTRMARRAILRSFRSAGEFKKIRANDEHRAQYVTTVYTPTSIKDKYYA